MEKELDDRDAKYRRLEEDHNRSQQERHQLSATEDDLRKREKNYSQRVQELERELETKNEIVSLTFSPPIMTFVVCSSHLLMFLGNLGFAQV